MRPRVLGMLGLMVPAQTDHKPVYVFLQLHPGQARSRTDSQLTRAVSSPADFGI